MNILLPLWLAFAPVGRDYEGAVSALEEAMDQVGKAETSESIDALTAVVVALQSYPEQLAADLELLDRLGEARLSIAWLHLSRRDKEAAAVAMDEALRSARGRQLPAGRFGQKVLRLYEDRQRVLGDLGSAVIEVDCRVPCQVIINELRSANPSDPLYLGDYRVWIGARDGSVPWVYHDVNLAEQGETRTLIFQPPPELDTSKTQASKPDAMKRLLPRWAELLGTGLGVGLAITGAVLLSFNGKCTDGGDPTICPRIYHNHPQGFSLLGIGMGVGIASGVLLTVDEVRIGRTHGKQAVLGWSVRF